MAHYYTDDDWGYGIVVTRPEYCDVEVLDVEVQGDPLIVGEKVTLYEDLTYHSANSSANLTQYPQLPYYTRNVPVTRPLGHRGYAREHLVDVRDGTVMNPRNGAVVCRDDAFIVSLTSFFASRDPQSWIFFTSTGVLANRYKMKDKFNPSNQSERMSYHQYRVWLESNAEMGHLQFFQSAQGGAHNSQGVFPWGTLLNFYIYRTPEANLEGRCYPPILPVAPRGRQNFVPLLPGQQMQLILPQQYKWSFKADDGDCPPLALKEKTKAVMGGWQCNYFICRRSPDASPQLVFFEATDSPRKGCVIVPPVEERADGRYAILHEPMDDMILFCNNIDGFVLRSQQDRLKVDKRKGWLDKQRSLMVECGYRFHLHSYEFFDLRVRILDKTKTMLKVNHLFDPDACTTA